MNAEHSISTLAVYCSASNSLNPEYYEIAAAVGQSIAEQGIRIVYGGGQVGLMGAVADGALNAGGQVVGVITEKLEHLELVTYQMQR